MYNVNDKSILAALLPASIESSLGAIFDNFLLGFA
jgi:hypothetical protein